MAPPMPDNDQSSSTGALRGLLAGVALERARLLAPFILFVVVFSLLTSESVGIALSVPVIVYNAIAIAGLFVLVIALLRRQIAERWGHTAMSIVWAVPVSTTLVSQLFSHNAGLHIVLVIETCLTAIQLHTAAVGWELGIVTALGAPLMLRDGGPAARIYVTSLVGAALFAFLVHLLMKRSLVRAEVHRLAEAATAKELAQRLAELQQAELARERLQEQLLHAQRMEAVGTLAAGLAHDMNNVLAAITSFADVLADEMPSPQARAELEQIIAQADRGAGLTRGLLAFARRGQYRKSVIAIDQIVDGVIPLLARTLPKSIEIRSECAEGLHVEADPVQLEQILVNLGLNAADAMTGSGTLSIAVDATELAAADALGVPAGRYARIRVTDTGSGMDVATRRRVFEPFFTTKPQGKGSGLGLSTVWGIVQAHHGAIEVDSTVGAGTTFCVYLPITPAPLTARPADAATPATPRRGRVLVVDDEPAVRAGTKRILEKMGLEAVIASNGAEAIELFEAEGPTIDLVILDMGMPVLGGAACFDRLRRTSRVPVLIATGYAIDAEAQDLVARGASLIEKPFRAKDLSSEVARLLDLR